MNDQERKAYYEKVVKEICYFLRDEQLQCEYNLDLEVLSSKLFPFPKLEQKHFGSFDIGPYLKKINEIIDDVTNEYSEG